MTSIQPAHQKEVIQTQVVATKPKPMSKSSSKKKTQAPRVSLQLFSTDRKKLKPRPLSNLFAQKPKDGLMP
ncbi:hypothetical protein ACFX13_000112 [Malus domestica]